jgi:hypothetical protein
MGSREGSVDDIPWVVKQRRTRAGLAEALLLCDGLLKGHRSQPTQAQPPYPRPIQKLAICKLRPEPFDLLLSLAL